MKFDDVVEWELGSRFHDLKGCEFVSPEKFDFAWFYGRKIAYLLEETFVLNGHGTRSHSATLRLIVSTDEYGMDSAVEVSVEDVETGERVYAHERYIDGDRISFSVEKAGKMDVEVFVFF